MSGGRGAEKASVFLLKTSACLLLCSSLLLIACCVAADMTGALLLCLLPVTWTSTVTLVFLFQPELRSSVIARQKNRARERYMHCYRVQSIYLPQTRQPKPMPAHRAMLELYQLP